MQGRENPLPIGQRVLASAPRDRPHRLGDRGKRCGRLPGHSGVIARPWRARQPHPLYIHQFHSSSHLQPTTLPSPRIPIHSIAGVLYYPLKSITLAFDTTNNGPTASFNTWRDLNPSKQTWGPWWNQNKHVKPSTPKSLETGSRPCHYIVQLSGTDRAFKHQQRDRTQHSTIQPLTLLKYSAEYSSDLIHGRQPKYPRNMNYPHRSRFPIFSPSRIGHTNKPEHDAATPTFLSARHRRPHYPPTELPESRTTTKHQPPFPATISNHR